MKLIHLALSSAKIRFLMSGMTMMFLAQPFLSSVVSAAPQPKSFEAWCRQKESVPANTRHTITSRRGYANDVLLNKAGTKNCKLADRKLKTLTLLNLNGNQIVDVKPSELG